MLRRIVQNCRKNVPGLDWPANSLVVNPIEHVWDMIGREVCRRPKPPQLLKSSSRIMEDDATVAEVINNINISVPLWINSVLQNRRSHIGYYLKCINFKI